MSEKKDGSTETFSGIRSNRRNPTVIGWKPVDTPSPRVICSEDMEQADDGSEGKQCAKNVCPTVIMKGSSLDTSGSQRDQSMPPFRARPVPRIMPGVVRRGVEVDVDELKKTHSGYTDEVYSRAIAILSGVVIDTLTRDDCLSFGASTAMRYEEVARESLAIVAVPAVADSVYYCGRVYELLGEIAKSFDAQPQNFFWIRPKIAHPLEKLEEFGTEWEQLRDHLQRLFPQLRHLSNMLLDVIDQSKSIAYDLDALCMACAHLPTVMDHGDDRAKYMIQRSDMFGKMAESVRGGNVWRQESLEQVEALMRRMEESIFCMLPAWLDQISRVEFSRITPTQRYSMQSELEAILNRLKS